MRRAQKQLNIDRALNVLDVYVAPPFLLIVGIILIILAFTLTFPEPDRLCEIRGHLDSYYSYQTGRGLGDYSTIISLREGPRFWTHAVNKENAEPILRGHGVEVQYYIDPHSTNVPMDGDAVKAYGL